MHVSLATELSKCLLCYCTWKTMLHELVHSRRMRELRAGSESVARMRELSAWGFVSIAGHIIPLKTGDATGWLLQ